MELNRCGCGGMAQDKDGKVVCQKCGCSVEADFGYSEMFPQLGWHVKRSARDKWNTAHPKAIRLDDVWNIRTCRSYEGDKSCDNCSVSGFCFVLTDGVYKEISDYVEGENGQI